MHITHEAEGTGYAIPEEGDGDLTYLNIAQDADSTDNGSPMDLGSDGGSDPEALHSIGN